MNEASASSVENSDTASSSGGSTAGGLSSRGPASSSGNSLAKSQWIRMSSSVHLSRSQQTWTGAGSAAGYVLRYLAPMRRLMIDVVGSQEEADRALAILVTHLVRSGFSGHDRGRLRDFLVRGVRSAAKARYDEAVQKSKKDKLESTDTAPAPATPKLDVAKIEAPQWLGYWRDGILQRSWRSLERYQHARRYEAVAPSPLEKEMPKEDYIHDVLRVAMAFPKESPKAWAGRLTPLGGRSIEPAEVQTQLELARIRFAQHVADEVAQTLEIPESTLIEKEIKTLGLGKAFMGVKVES